MAEVQPIPQDATGIIPHLVCGNAGEAIDFYVKAFGAKEVMRMPAGDKIMHAEIRIGNSPIYLCDDFPEFCGGKERTPDKLGGTPVTIHQYVVDCDAAIAKAEAAGATVSMPAQDMFWGDRYGQVTDTWGHVWSFATQMKILSPDEMAEAQKAAFGG